MMAGTCTWARWRVELSSTFERVTARPRCSFPLGGDGRLAVTGIKAHKGLLYVSGAATGLVFIYDLKTKALVFKGPTGLVPPGSSFVNDVDLAADGSAYFTDSRSPYLYRVARGANGVWFLALIVQSNTGKLFRVGTVWCWRTTMMTSCTSFPGPPV